MTRASRIVVSIAALATILTGCGKSPTAPTTPTTPIGTPPTASSLTLVSGTGEFIGGGRTYSYTVANARFRPIMNLDRTHLHVNVDSIDGREWWTIDATAPQGETLTTRTYTGALRFANLILPGPAFNFSGTGRGCGPLNASFTIRELALGSLGEVTVFHMIFEQYCDNSTGLLSGDLRIAAAGTR